MNWQQEAQTAAVAAHFHFPIHAQVAVPQALGPNFNPVNWNRRVINQAWPAGPLQANPDLIIHLFQAQHYLEALAMTICWGGMRGHAAIYGNRNLPTIHAALHQCAQSIQNTDQAQDAWLILTGHRPPHLGWSAVMASKTLHFLSRALQPADGTPPVPRDNAVSLGHVWPGWIAHVPPGDRPQSWKGNTFGSYNRYMTAILVWAEHREWTTTQVETTIFSERAV